MIKGRGLSINALARACVLTVLLCGFSAEVWAATLKTELDKEVIIDGESIVLYIEGNDLTSTPDTAPLLVDFEIVQSGVSQSTSIVNGKRTVGYQIRLELRPKRLGKLRIPALSVGDVASSPLTVEVVARGTPGIEPRDNVFVEVTVDNAEGWQQDGWFREVEIDHFIHHFEHFQYDWLDVPAMLRSADCAYENPMIDRDPIPTWVDGPVALMGDAAHAMYPTGSNGASQAIVDARVIGANILKHGVTATALTAYDDQLCSKISDVVLRNRSAGPFGLLDLLDKRCGGVFDNIQEVLPDKERYEFMAQYKQAAGFAMEQLNDAPPTIPSGSKLK